MRAKGLERGCLNNQHGDWMETEKSTAGCESSQKADANLYYALEDSV